MGGVVPLGYDLEDRHLVVNPEEASPEIESFFLGKVVLCFCGGFWGKRVVERGF
jgi:hypothetical protein